MANNLKTYLGAKVREARHAKGLTQEQLAERIEKTVETVSNIERGHTFTGLETLERIARCLDTPLQDLFEGFEERRHVSRGRLDLELEIQSLVRGLSDKDVRSAIELVGVLAKRRSK